MRVYRKSLFSATAAALLVGFAGSAAGETVIQYPTGVTCPTFPLTVTLYDEQGHLHNRLFSDKNGNPVRFFEAGQNFPVKFTNETTGASYTVKPEGTVASYFLNPDGTETMVFTGHTLIGYSVMEVPDASPAPATIRYVGRLVLHVLNGNVLTIPEFKGKQTNICDLLK